MVSKTYESAYRRVKKLKSNNPSFFSDLAAAETKEEIEKVLGSHFSNEYNARRSIQRIKRAVELLGTPDEKNYVPELSQATKESEKWKSREVKWDKFGVKFHKTEYEVKFPRKKGIEAFLLDKERITPKGLDLEAKEKKIVRLSVGIYGKDKDGNEIKLGRKTKTFESGSAQYEQMMEDLLKGVSSVVQHYDIKTVEGFKFEIIDFK